MCTIYNRNYPRFIPGDFHCWMKHSVRYDRPVCLAQSFPLNSSLLSHRTIFSAGSFRHTHTHTHDLVRVGGQSEEGALSVRVLVVVARDLLANSSGSLQAKTCSWAGLSYTPFSSRTGRLLQLCQPVLNRIADACFDFKRIISRARNSFFAWRPNEAPLI